MTYNFARTNPKIHKAIMITLICLMLFMGFMFNVSKSHAIFPFIIAAGAMTATEYITIGSLAVASGLIITHPDQTAAIIQDIWRKGVDLFTPAVEEAETTGKVTLTAEQAEFLQRYATEDATTLTGSTLEYYSESGEALTAPWDLTIEEGALMTDATTAFRNNDGTEFEYVDQAHDLSDLIITSDPVQDMLIQPFSDFLRIEFDTQVANTESIDLGPQTVVGYQIHGLQTSGTSLGDVIITMYMVDSLGNTVDSFNPVTDGSYQEFATPYTDIAYIAFWGTNDGNKLWHWSEMEFFTQTQSVSALQEISITAGEFDVDLEWAKANNLTGTVVDTLPTTGATTAEAIEAITGAVATDVTITDATTGNPYTPKLPPTGTPQLPWWAFFAYFLDMLRAMIEYVVRLVAFIITLQGLQAIGVGEYSEVYSWFRNLSLAGLNVYSIVMSLAGLSMSLMIYRVVKRV